MPIEHGSRLKAYRSNLWLVPASLACTQVILKAHCRVDPAHSILTVTMLNELLDGLTATSGHVLQAKVWASNHKEACRDGHVSHLYVACLFALARP